MTYTFPKQARKYQRSLSGSLELELSAGAIPADLTGFVYVVSPEGRDVEAPGRAGGIPFLNGDGVVYRIALGPKVELKWALTKPPCWWAEVSLPPDDTTDWGITRLFDDITLGGRNELNTAFQAVRFQGDTSDRLLVTYEAGRPFEVDPETLEVVTPVGKRDAWLPAMMPDSVFQVIAGTSHPAFDPQHDAKGQQGPGTLFAVSFVRDANLFIERILRFLGLDDEYEKLEALVGDFAQKIMKVDDLVEDAAKNAKGPLALLDFWPEVAEETWKAWQRFRKRAVFGPAEARLLWWSGAAEPEHVTLVDATGRALRIDESAHQMGVTEHFIVLMDAAFKFEMDAVFPDLDFLPKDAVALVRRRLSRIQPQAVKIHLVPRKDLAPGKTVTVQTIELPGSVVHYFVDYADHGGTKITVTAIDNAACDPAEFLLDDDTPAFLLQKDMPWEVQGMIACGVDVDRIVRFELDVAKGKAVPISTCADPATMWTLALATGPGQFGAAPPKTVGDVYVFTHGLIPAGVSQLVWSLYNGSQYARRIMSVTDVATAAAAGGIAPRLLRWDATAPGAIADSYEVPAGWLVLSPQCVPGGTRGYVVTCAFSDADKEIWIFDGADLAKGPIAKLRAPAGKAIPWAYTLHTTYLAEAKPRPAGGYRVTMADDLASVPKIPQVVTDDVVPRAYVPGAQPSMPPPPPASAPVASAVDGRLVLDRIARTYGEIAARHPVAGETHLDGAIARFELEVLATLDRKSLGAAMIDDALGDERNKVFEAHEAALERILLALRPLDRLALTTSFAETDVRRVYARLGQRALRLWATGRAEAEIRSLVVAGIQAFTALVRADPSAPERSALTRALTLQGLASPDTHDLAAERRAAQAIVKTLLGPGF